MPVNTDTASAPDDGVDGREGQSARDLERLMPLLKRWEPSTGGLNYVQEPECQETISGLESLRFSDEDCRTPLTQPLGEYQLLKVLGRGGMGTVFQAEHRRLGKTVAVKTIAGRLARHSPAVERFVREMRAAGAIRHANVVCATDAGEIGGVHFLVMELIDGINLRQLVARQGVLTLREACEIGRQAALGLQAVHDQGLVHRDVKPSNLMLTTEGQVKLTDLGLAYLRLEPAGAGREFVGTAAYTAPEQWRNAAEVDGRADIYSLGRTLCYLMSGQEPRGPARPSSTPAAGPAASTSEHSVPALVNAQLRSVIARCLADDPAERFASAHELAQALAPLALGAELNRLLRPQQRSVADRAPPSSPTPAAFRRWPRRVVLAGIGLTASGAAAAFLVRYASLREGAVKLDLDPPDAQVHVNGELHPRAASPSLMLTLPPGKYQLAISREGYNRWSDVVEIRPGRQTPLEIRLQPLATYRSPGVRPPVHSVDQVEQALAEWALGRGGHLTLFSGTQVKRMADLPRTSFRIQAIVLSRVRLRDDELKQFLGLPNLQGLELSHNELTSHAAAILSQIPSLRWLYLPGNTAISDLAAPHLATLRNLEALNLSATRVTDETVSQLTACTKLRELRLGDTKVTSFCLPDIGRLPALVRLDISRDRIEDVGLEHLQANAALKYLLLASTELTDAAVQPLSALASLRELDLSHTDLSPTAIRSLREALPQCQVTA